MTPTESKTQPSGYSVMCFYDRSLMSIYGYNADGSHAGRAIAAWEKLGDGRRGILVRLYGEVSLTDLTRHAALWEHAHAALWDRPGRALGLPST